MFNGKEYNFTNELTIENLKSGNHTICITIKGETYKQCFDFVIESVTTISGKISLVKNKAVVHINEGSGPYFVYKNNEVFMSTNQKYFELSVGQGDQIQVKGKANCQGVLSKNIDLFEATNVYPNPTTGKFNINIPTAIDAIQVKVYNSYSQLIVNKLFTVIGGVVQVDISNKPSGVYYVKLGAKELGTIKIVKY